MRKIRKWLIILKNGNIIKEFKTILSEIQKDRFFYALKKRLGCLYQEIFYLRDFKKDFINNVNRVKRWDNIEGTIDFALYNKNFFIKPSQICNEIAILLKILKDNEPKYILEIGTYAGATLLLFSQIASENAIIISIDLPGGSHGGGYPYWKVPIFKSFASSNRRIFLIRDDSHKLSTLKKVKRILKNKQLDFLFIDGDHSYRGVKRDFEIYSNLVKENGLIAFHDIVKYPLESKCEVDKLWNEIKHDFSFQELVENWNQEWGGIGIIVKKSN